MTEETPQGSTKRTSLQDIMPEVKRILPMAVALVVPVLIFGYLIASRSPSSTQAGATPAVADSEAVLVYSKPVPVRLDPHPSADVFYYLPLAKDGQTGKEKNYGFLTLNAFGGIRISPNGSLWVIVVFRDETVFQEYFSDNEEIKHEMYAPAEAFKPGPGGGGVPGLKFLNLG
jgi:hypothetical protein